ncbi:MAG: NADH-quinone oxidoreductase subunit A, partial [Planctomycetes bacterium]|nr:NADH-quinone oxidoreductase subunit A [Planctomycetota bacterium]
MTDYGQLVGYLGLGFVLGAFALVVPWLVSPRYKGPKTEQTYECGVDPVGSA